MQLELCRFGKLQLTAEFLHPLEQLPFPNIGEDVIAAFGQCRDQRSDPLVNWNKPRVLILGGSVATAQADMEHPGTILAQTHIAPEHLFDFTDSQASVGQCGDDRLFNAGG